MPFEPGNDLSRKSRLIHNAMKRAVMAEDGARIRRGIERILDLYAEGDPFALVYVRDTLDGKPQQAVEVSATGTLQDALKRIALQPVPDALTSAITIEAEHDATD